MSENFPPLSREQILEVLAQNAEMRRLLGELQFSGLTPIKSGGVCPSCCGSSRHGNRPGCELLEAIERPPLGESLTA